MIFVSHSKSTNLDFVTDYLKAKGIESRWVDHENIKVGDEVREKILDGLQRSACCLFLLNHFSAKSPWCLAEVGAFLGASKRIIVFPDSPGRRNIPPFLRGLRIANTREEMLAACQEEIAANQPSSFDHRSLMNLFRRCGLANTFRVPAKKHDREDRVLRLVEEEGAREHPEFRLLASSGHSFLNCQGPIWKDSLSRILDAPNAKYSVVLQSPDSDFAVARALANNVSHHHWLDGAAIVPTLRELQKRRNISIHVTDLPINCSLFFTSRAVLYDPYLWAQPVHGRSTENHFWVFEFEKIETNEPEYECYHHLGRHFDFLFENSVPSPAFLKGFRKRSHEFARKLHDRQTIAPPNP